MGVVHSAEDGAMDIQWGGGVDFDPDGPCGGGVASMGGKAKVLSSLKPLELQSYFAPFSKAAK